MIVTLTGPSCSGKTTLESLLKNEGFINVISHTTRKPRPGEISGQAYYFVSESEFERMGFAGELVESVCFDGNHYGMACGELARVEASGKPIVIVADPAGKEQIVAYCKSAGIPFLTVFIDNSPDVLMERYINTRLMPSIKSLIGINADDAALGWNVRKHMKRIECMRTTEREWVRAAYENPDNYDLVFTHFNESHNADAVDLVKRMVDRRWRSAA